MRRLAYLLAALTGLWVPSPARAAEPPPFAWKDGDRAVLIGDALIEREQEEGMVETFITLLNPDKSITFRNLGWSGDTVHGTARARFGTEADGFKHLVEHVLALKPTVLIVGYGMTDSFAGLAGLPRFKSGMNHLLEVLSQSGARVVLLAPIAHEDRGRPLPDPTRHNEVLRLYSAAIRAIATDREAWFVDLFELFRSHMAEKRGQAGAQPLTDDGIHLNKSGYSAMAVFIGCGHNFRSVEGTTTDITPTPHGLRFERTLDFMFPSSRARGENFAVRDLFTAFRALGEERFPDGRYRLTIDGRKVAEGEAREWRKGVVDCSFSPNLEQAEQVRQAVIAKNRLYFYRWRPQNETYLFGFRKHEQGNNAREIPLFDPLVEEKEKEIARLKVPVKHVYELIREGEEAK